MISIYLILDIYINKCLYKHINMKILQNQSEFSLQILDYSRNDLNIN